LIAAENERSEGMRRRGDPVERFVERSVCQDRQDRSEDLLIHYVIVPRHWIDDRRSEVSSLRIGFPSDYYLRWIDQASESQDVVDTNRRIIDHGDIITAGGFLSWVDLCLFLVERILGPAIRAETARFALDDPAAAEARYLTGFAPPQTHGDRAVLKAQDWVHMRDGRDVSLAALAGAAGLGRRTLLRRFASATGMTPIEYCRRVRIARARELLEGETPQKLIAQSLGYNGVATFAHAFRKAVGLAPGAYRKKFGRKGISPANFTAKDGVRQEKHLSEASSHAG
jgi:AraC-like DNA-binding protein